MSRSPLKNIALAVLSFATFISFPLSVEAFQGYGVTSNQSLVTWELATPGTLTSSVSISGLQANEQIIGIDFRPANGDLFGIGSMNRAYTINPMTGAATQVGSPFPTALVGQLFGFDFNPTIDRSRIDSDEDRNYVINPNDGSQSVVTNLFYPAGDANAGANPNVTHIGYTNSFAGATSSQLYGIDSGLDILVTQANSAGTLGTVGSLGLNINGVGGFDIDPRGNLAYGAFQLEGSSGSGLYQLNLATGSASLIGSIGSGETITAFAVAVPEPTTFGLIGVAGIVGMLRRRKK